MGRSQAGTAQWSVLGSAGAGDQSERAIRTLYDEQVAPLYRYVLRLVDGDRYLAEDIVQETLLRCWRCQDLSLDGTTLRPWLFRVARNLVIDAARRRSAGPKEIGAAEWLSELSPGVDETEALLSAVVVDRALQKLSTAHRQVLFETFFVGRPGPDAAAAIGVAPGTVKSRLHYALRALRHALAQGDVRPAGDVPRSLASAGRRTCVRPSGSAPAVAPDSGRATHTPAATTANHSGRYRPGGFAVVCGRTGERTGDDSGDTSRWRCEGRES